MPARADAAAGEVARPMPAPAAADAEHRPRHPDPYATPREIACRGAPAPALSPATQRPPGAPAQRTGPADTETAGSARAAHGATRAMPLQVLQSRKRTSLLREGACVRG